MDLTIQDQMMARPPQPSCVLCWREGVPLTLAALIRERVCMELDRAMVADGARPLIECGQASDGDEAARERAIALALEGFQRNAFFVLVDDHQVTDLEATILLKPGTAITFVRLMPLVSG